MDITNHATQGFLATYIPLHLFNVPHETIMPWAIASLIIGILPDVAADLDSVGLPKWTQFSQRWYEDCHTFKKWWINILHPSTIHINLDSFGHGEGQRWYTAEHWWDYFNPFKWFEIGAEARWLEGLTWYFNLTLVGLLFLGVSWYWYIVTVIIAILIGFITKRFIK